MAATGQAAAGGEGQAQGQGGEAVQNGSEQGQGSDLGQLVQQLVDGQQAQGQSMEEMRSFLASNPWAAQQVQEASQQQEQGLDLSFLDPQTSWTEDPAQLGQRLNDVISQAV